MLPRLNVLIAAACELNNSFIDAAGTGKFVIRLLSLLILREILLVTVPYCAAAVTIAAADFIAAATVAAAVHAYDTCSSDNAAAAVAAFSRGVRIVISSLLPLRRDLPDKFSSHLFKKAVVTCFFFGAEEKLLLLQQK